MPNPDDIPDLTSAPVEQLRAILGSRRPTLAQNLISFAHLCKIAGLDVTTARVIDEATQDNQTRYDLVDIDNLTQLDLNPAAE